LSAVGREPLSKGAREFISAHVHSVRQLELLLLVRSAPDRAVTASAVAASLRVAPRWAGSELAAMHAGGLLDLEDDAADEPAYRYAAAPGEDRLVAELEETYRRRKPTVIQAILTAMDSDVQALSDAFRIRGPRDG
jgi:hypothetical protein